LRQRIFTKTLFIISIGYSSQRIVTVNKKSPLSAFLTIILVGGLVLASAMRFGTVQASIPKPSVPEFTLKYVDNSYDVPPSYGIDQYTGEKVITNPGYHVDDRAFEFTIKNQPFTPYPDASGNDISLYYNFRFKGPYGDDWSYYPYTDRLYGLYTGFFPDTSASKSEYTVITVTLRALNSNLDATAKILTGSNVEFQVQAIIGYIKISHTGLSAGDFYSFTGERSDWSNTQTILVSESQTSTPSPKTTPTPTSSPSPTPYSGAKLTEQEIIIGIAIIAVVIGAGLGLLIYLIKRK
jgi:hypothetical protein